jgi:hypothetical protein
LPDRAEGSAVDAALCAGGHNSRLLMVLFRGHLARR